MTIIVGYFAESGSSTKKNFYEQTDISSYPSKQNVSSPNKMSQNNTIITVHSEKSKLYSNLISRTSSQINLNFSSLTISSKKSLSERPGGGEGALITADFETDSENPEGKNRYRA